MSKSRSLGRKIRMQVPVSIETIYVQRCTVNNDLGTFTLYSFNDPVPQAVC